MLFQKVLRVGLPISQIIAETRIEIKLASKLLLVRRKRSRNVWVCQFYMCIDVCQEADSDKLPEEGDCTIPILIRVSIANSAKISPRSLSNTSNGISLGLWLKAM